MPIKVRAVFPRGGFGFDGQARRYDGDEFTIDESLFSESWMERVEEEPKPKRKRRTRQVAEEPEGLE